MGTTPIDLLRRDNPMHYELIEDGIKVSLHDECGEGCWGDYDPTDPEDTPLLRFDVDALPAVWEKYSRRGQAPDQEWIAIDDASYCTQLSAETMTPEQGAACVQLIMQKVKGNILGGSSIKRICEGLSWLDSKALCQFAPGAFATE